MTELMIVFLIIGGVGFLFLLLSLLIGDLFEAIGFEIGIDASHDFGIFDSRVIAVFLTSFGGFGIISTILGFGVALSSLSGLLGGFIFGAIVFYFGKLLYSQQSSSSVSENDLIGRTAQVIVSIHPGQIGQISCLIGEERVEKLARTAAGETIKAGQRVRIDEIGSDSVIVSIDDGARLSLFSNEN